jgi:hypothetical protein
MPEGLLEKECAEVMTEINAVENPDPNYEHYDYDTNLKLNYLAGEHGPWLVKSHDPAAKQPIGTLVRLYLRNPKDNWKTVLIVVGATAIVVFAILLIRMLRRGQRPPITPQHA